MRYKFSFSAPLLSHYDDVDAEYYDDDDGGGDDGDDDDDDDGDQVLLQCNKNCKSPRPANPISLSPDI